MEMPTGYLAGTSMAAPHVSGVVALLIARGFVGPNAICSRLRDTAVDLGPAGWDQFFGYGLVNAAAAVGGSNPSSMMRAFAGTISGSSITHQSDVATVAATGSFTITNAQSGTRSVFAWQDFNSNGQVDLGDYYGPVDNVVINPGGTTSRVVVTVRIEPTTPGGIHAGRAAGRRAHGRRSSPGGAAGRSWPAGCVGRRVRFVRYSSRGNHR